MVEGEVFMQMAQRAREERGGQERGKRTREREGALQAHKEGEAGGGEGCELEFRAGSCEWSRRS